MENFEELPIQKFYFSMSYLLTYSGSRGDSPNQAILEVYSIVDSYYLESLAILRSSKNAEKQVIEEIETQLKKSREKLLEINKSREIMNDTDKEFSDYLQMQHVTHREQHFKSKDLEIEMNSIASIVMILSLLESTLLRINRELILHDLNLPKVNDVMKRNDNGIVKQLKYLEKYVEQQEKHFIVGTKLYEELLFWMKVRNNIVHNNNLISKEIEENSEKLKIQLNRNRITKKYRFKYEDALNVANLCGLILDKCIVKGLYSYFDVEG
ncbi:hypothetical protein [Lysinibacillus boronitolerans]|uniref:hypothetical protein n=1 Tax=Lysinibacillus boronitolerans TaxID=309788 RepID=UPI003852611A